ncbi:MAG TPA: FkbM family methyltransferase [Acidimicrobiales bacterium]|jgi:FkbM family methyltransferase|nr:FkbM family methyltransferase [Acidimicrobiales bacterium]
MPATKMQRREAFVRTNLPWRKVFAKRVVHRHVQGVDLFLPWAHVLPDFASMRPSYGQNLVELAKGLEAQGGTTGEPMKVMDIGANIGDSAAQILAATNSEVLCVEGDPYWANFLRKNLAANPRATIEEALLTPDDVAWDVSPIRTYGTTRFAQGEANPDALPALSTRALRDKHPRFANLRLIKSDTDGFDPGLVPAAAEAWMDSAPVLFFEFDPILAKAADNPDPNAMWEKLAKLGYSRLVAWDNTGDPLGQFDIADALRWAGTLEPRPTHLGYDFWDVAACRSDDAAAAASFDALVPEPFDIRGIWR